MQKFSPLTIELKRSSITPEGYFEAYGAVFDNIDADNDVFVKGAFSTAIKRHEDSGSRPAMLWSHQTDLPIGRWLELKEDSKGLWAYGKLTTGITRGKEALELLRDDAIGFSVGFSLEPQNTEQKAGVRYIKQVTKLFEISLVAIPSNERARVKYQKPTTPRELEELLREVAGFSRRFSKRVVASGWKSARDERNHEHDRLIKLEEAVERNTKLLERLLP